MDSVGGLLKPDVDLHVHLRGAAPREYFFKKLKKYSQKTICESFLDRHLAFLKSAPHLTPFFKEGASPEHLLTAIFSFSSFETFLASYLVTAYLVRDEEDLEDLVRTVYDSFIAQGISYAEIIVSPNQYLVSGEMSLACILNVLANVSHHTLKRAWVLDPVRDRGADACERLLVDSLKLQPSLFSAVTLGGNEINYPPKLFTSFFALAKEAGLGCSIHAGEALGAESVRYAVEELGCKRIGHGVRAIEDDAVCKLLVEKGVMLEVCISSNLFTGVYASLEVHPAYKLYQKSIALALCTDDPVFFDTTLSNEYVLATRLGFSVQELRTLQEVSLRHIYRQFVD